MTEAPTAPPSDPAGGVVYVVEVLSKRADFLKAARARRAGTTAYTLQARKRHPDDADPALIRVGFTCSKKVGNAVARNRAKRRLREIARLVLPTGGRPGWDYVLIGRPVVTATHSFEAMLTDMRAALAKVHG